MSAFSPITRIAGSLAVAAALTGVPVHSQQVDSLVSETDSAKEPSALKVQPFAESPKPPETINLKADRQSFDARRGVFVAEGNVRAELRGGLLQADRIEFDTNFNTLYARGSVRLRRGSQYFQASTFRYSLIQNSGELKDVYGVLELDELSAAFQSSSQTFEPPSKQTLPVRESSSLGFPTALDMELGGRAAGQISDQPSGDGIWETELAPTLTWEVPEPVANASTSSSNASTPTDSGMVCPVPLPPIPDWHPHPWAVTAWGGQMIDSNFGDTFLFNGRMREEYLLGVSMQKRIWRAGPFALELEADLFGHQAFKQPGGPFNQAVPNADTPKQQFGEAILGLGARLWLQPWLSFGFVEGVSFNSSVSNYERTYRENYTQLLNYLAFELEASVSDQLSFVGRIHHRSGAFGSYSGVKEGSNAYLLGLRYRWGEEPIPPQIAEVPPPLGCPDPDRASRPPLLTLNEKLEEITLGTGGKQAVQPVQPLAQSRYAGMSRAEQEALREQAIAMIDQRISSIQLQQRFTIERPLGGNGELEGLTNKDIEEEAKYGAVRPEQLPSYGKPQLIDGQISRWRIQAAQVSLTPEGWTADRMGFTNDPFTPAQTRIDTENVVAKEQPNGDVLIKTSRNQLIVEERLPIPISRTQRITKEEEVENRWVFGIDNDDRDGFFIGNKLRPIELNQKTLLSLQPQLLLQRAVNGSTKSYVNPGSSIDSDKVSQSTTAGDLFGLETELTSEIWGWTAEANADISTFNPDNIANGSRFWGELKKSIDLPLLGDVKARLFSAYRYRAYNGSLGETDVYSAFGSFLEQRGNFRAGKISNDYIWRLGAGNYQAEQFESENLTDLWRANFYGSLNSRYEIWRGKPAPLTPQAAYRYSPVAIVPGLAFRANVNTLLAAYGDGERQTTISLSGGPSLTLGTFSKPFLDYTQLSITGGGTLKQGSSPFSFDQAIDLGTLGLGVTQQIAGPLIINLGVGLNIDPASEFYGDVLDSNIELRWQRRAYDFGFYFNPYQGIGGFRFRLNDFNFTGTGVPFIPYNPSNELDNRPF
ncbi:DUF3769 domain-containing protein [bacterium]|nr:DUF3769 domain-containing protein [bacterium]